jgi:predicted metalloprotease with PDZ domain
MLYKIIAQNPHKQVIEVEYCIPAHQSAELTVQLPFWRPGRYEAGNFGRHILGWQAKDKYGNLLSFKKIGKERWLVNTPTPGNIHIYYSYYAAELTAGSTFFNEQMLYVNPVNCLMFVPERVNEACEVQIHWLPSTYEIACQMEKKGQHVLIAPDYDYLADSPFIASESLKHFHFHLDASEIHLWFTGTFTGDFGEMLEHTHAYCKKQVEVFGEFPCRKFHFLYHILPYRFHHGVEHLDSTVIALGPAENFSDIGFYREFLGVSSHEFYHLWNVKRIRPAEMWPYDFTRENFSRQGYVYEGVTTYMGDLMLLRSGVFEWDEYCAEFNDFLQRHFDNYGRYNLSVAASSWDTWIDGYVLGVPGRKVSIYVEGALAAFILDTIIMKATRNEHSLDELMRRLYYRFYKQNKGYTQQDYIQLIEELCGEPQMAYVQEVLEGCGHIENYLPSALNYIGCALVKDESPMAYERFWGMKVQTEGGQCVVKAVAPGSPADAAGIAVQDVIRAVNEHPVTNETELEQWINAVASHEAEVELQNTFMKKKVAMLNNEQTYWHRYSIQKIKDPGEAQQQAFALWAHQPF